VASAFSFDERVAACDLCNSVRLSTVSAEANVVECLECGYRFVNPRPSQAEIANSYSDPDFYAGWIEDEAGRARMWSKRLDLVKGAGRGVHVLDVGAGIGTFLQMGRDRFGWNAVGTEVSTSAVRVARERYGLNLLLGRVEDLALPAGSFDLITLWHVLEHVPSPSLTLKLCHDLLHPNGLLAIAVPNDSDARRWLRGAKSKLRRQGSPPGYSALSPKSEVHLSYFSIPVLVQALRTRGFRIERVTLDDQYANPTPRTRTIVETYRIIHRLTTLNFGQATFVLARSATRLDLK
jgi:2-polyprenyl-3-methyl-5-hydroxy-6-metoxy-1,4-benzoquinol methylase